MANLTSAAPMAEAICGPHFSAPVTSTFNMLTSTLLCRAVTRDVRDLSSKFQYCIIFRLRVNGEHGTQG